jgi:hypothetical protein
MMAAGTTQDIMVAIGDYPIRQKDDESLFYGKRLIFLSWENHLMFAAPLCVPLPPTLPFGALIRDVLPDLYGEHPEFEDIDWKRTQWLTQASASYLMWANHWSSMVWATKRSSVFVRLPLRAVA